MNPLPSAHETEAARQRALLAALVAPGSPAAAGPGIDVYRSNAHASARRALEAACPTLHALLGGEDFAQLARAFWHAHPPQRGDLGEWGEALPGWIARQPALDEWPYLADCARLDLAVHQCERAADAAFEAPSLDLLASRDPASLRLCLMPGLAAIGSVWPLASIHAAHAADDERLFDLARERLRQRQGEAVVVARDGWRAAVHRIDPPGLAFMHALQGGADLAQALDRAGADFDFTGWLADALRCRWLQAVRPAAT